MNDTISSVQNHSPRAEIEAAAGRPDCPFVAGAMIRDPRLFVGRKAELRNIAARMQGAQPTSINVVGERRTGKSSLLYYLFLTGEQRVRDPARYVLAYVSLQDARTRTESAFFRTIAGALQKIRSFPNSV